MTNRVPISCTQKQLGTQFTFPAHVMYIGGWLNQSPLCCVIAYQFLHMLRGVASSSDTSFDDAS